MFFGDGGNPNQRFIFFGKTKLLLGRFKGKRAAGIGVYYGLASAGNRLGKPGPGIVNHFHIDYRIKIREGFFIFERSFRICLELIAQLIIQQIFKQRVMDCAVGYIVLIYFKCFIIFALIELLHDLARGAIEINAETGRRKAYYYC